MIPRRRLVVWAGVFSLLIAGILTVRTMRWSTPPAPAPSDIPHPIRIDRFAADNVVLPQPGPRPHVPSGLTAVPGPGQLRLHWADGGGTVQPESIGYELRWRGGGEPEHTRLVITPAAQLDDLVDGVQYQVEVRGVDAFGQRSDAARMTAAPGHEDTTWQRGLSGLFDTFSSKASVRSDVPGSRWHVSGYRGCADIGEDGSARHPQLAVDLRCGTDRAVLRARSPMRLVEPTTGSGELGHVAVVTDTAGPGGTLTVDLVPGPADRVGAEVADASSEGGATDTDPTLPPGAVRVVVGNGGTRVLAAADVPRVAAPPTAPAATGRGVAVLHRFEVILTTVGVRVLQDGQLTAASGVVPAWREAYVLLGVKGPEGRVSRVHVAAAGFSGPPVAPSPVVETEVIAAAQQVLGLDEDAPGIGVSRQPLVSAVSARLVATVIAMDGLDPTQIVVQLGDRLIPAVPAVPGHMSSAGSMITVAAELPADLLGQRGPESLSPFVLRAPVSPTSKATIVETYLETVPAPGQQPTPASTHALYPQSRQDGLPAIHLELRNAAGGRIGSRVPPRSRLVVETILDGTADQWATGALAGVSGIQVRLDGALVAALPTALEGPGVGGRYTFSIELGELAAGHHFVEVKEYGTDGRRAPLSALNDFTSG